MADIFNQMYQKYFGGGGGNSFEYGDIPARQMAREAMADALERQKRFGDAQAQSDIDKANAYVEQVRLMNREKAIDPKKTAEAQSSVLSGLHPALAGIMEPFMEAKQKGDASSMASALGVSPSGEGGVYLEEIAKTLEEAGLGGHAASLRRGTPSAVAYYKNMPMTKSRTDITKAEIGSGDRRYAADRSFDASKYRADIMKQIAGMKAAGKGTGQPMSTDKLFAQLVMQDENLQPEEKAQVLMTYKSSNVLSKPSSGITPVVTTDPSGKKKLDLAEKPQPAAPQYPTKGTGAKKPDMSKY